MKSFAACWVSLCLSPCVSGCHCLSLCLSLSVFLCLSLSNNWISKNWQHLEHLKKKRSLWVNMKCKRTWKEKKISIAASNLRFTFCCMRHLVQAFFFSFFRMWTPWSTSLAVVCKKDTSLSVCKLEQIFRSCLNFASFCSKFSFLYTKDEK